MHRTIERFSHKFLLLKVLLIDEKGNATLQEMRRADILKMTHEAAHTASPSSQPSYPVGSAENPKASSLRQPDLPPQAPRREPRRSFTAAYSGSGGGAPVRSVCPYCSAVFSRSTVVIGLTELPHSCLQLVHMRDLRRLDTTFSETNEPCIAVRKQAVLINAGAEQRSFCSLVDSE